MLPSVMSCNVTFCYVMCVQELQVCCQCQLEQKEAQCREREDGLQQELSQAQERIVHLEMLLK